MEHRPYRRTPVSELKASNVNERLVQYSPAWMNEKIQQEKHYIWRLQMTVAFSNHCADTVWPKCGMQILGLGTYFWRTFTYLPRGIEGSVDLGG